MCLQELKLEDDQFPREELGELGYEAVVHGQKAWNGVAILSKAGLEDVTRGIDDGPGFPEPEARAISATASAALPSASSARARVASTCG